MPTLERVFLLPVLMSALVLTACHPSFNVTVTGSSTIPASALPLGGLLPVDFGQFTALNLSSTEEFKNQGVSKDEIQSVKLTSVTLSVTSPSGGNFDFINSIAFAVSADGQATQQVASKDSIPAGSTHLSLDLAGVELAPYVAAPSMSVTTSAMGMSPPQDTTVEATLVFNVVPKIP
jgi:hypothetical protein